MEQQQEEQQQGQGEKGDNIVKAILYLLGAFLIWWCFIRAPSEKPSDFSSPKKTSPLPSSKPIDLGRVVINVKAFFEDELGIVTVKGNVKNFTDKVIRLVNIRFTFYDRQKRQLHTETRYVVFLEDFRPGDVKAFSEQFFDLDKRASRVVVQIENWSEGF